MAPQAQDLPDAAALTVERWRLRHCIAIADAGGHEALDDGTLRFHVQAREPAFRARIERRLADVEGAIEQLAAERKPEPVVRAA